MPTARSLPGSIRTTTICRVRSSAAVSVLNAHPEAVLVYGNMQAVDADGPIINMLKYPQVSLQDLLCFTIIGQPAVFIRRRALEAVGGLDTRFHLLLGSPTLDSDWRLRARYPRR